MVLMGLIERHKRCCKRECVQKCKNSALEANLVKTSNGFFIFFSRHIPGFVQTSLLFIWQSLYFLNVNQSLVNIFCITMTIEL